MAGRGPLPEKTRRRVNKPTIPTRSLPAAGFGGPYPRPPRWITLGKEGAAWWRWAWRTPQAASWSDGDLAAIARRAELEDDKAALRTVRGLNVDQVLALVDDEQVEQAIRQLEFLVRSLAALAAGKLAIYAKMLDLDRQLGLTTKASLDLRNEIVGEAEPTPAPAAKQPGQVPAGPRRLRAVDPSALAGA